MGPSGWQLDAVYSCSQKGLGAPSGVAPVVFSRTALDRRVDCRSFYFDFNLLMDYWVNRRYHHTMCAPLVYALREALVVVEEEGLEARWARHERHHQALVAGVDGAGLGPLAGRIWRVGLMGASSTIALVTLFLSAMEDALHTQPAKLSTT
jgi:alanine-glyoxylate transaminase/serine-glyoxylate transaminase/serine-pyruvate transaminase